MTDAEIEESSSEWQYRIPHRFVAFGDPEKRDLNPAD